MKWQGGGELASKSSALLGLIGPSKIFFQTTFHMRLSSVMTDIHFGLTIESRS